MPPDLSIPEVSPVADEEFLYHLYRGSELLMEDRVVEAKEELERALRVQPQDAKGQDLLAGVYFRLGVYPRAIEIWSSLVVTYTRDATLRVNLALALLKTGQPADALEHLHLALQIQPDHERAWGYLGLVHWRLGRYHDARESFLRGGQASMARRMEEVLSSSAGQVPAPSSAAAAAPTPESQERRHDADVDAMRSAAEQAIERFEADQVPLQLERPSPAEARVESRGEPWKATEPGEEKVPRRPRRSSRQLPAAAPPRLGALVDAWHVSIPEGSPLAVGPGGELFIVTEHSVMSRLSGLKAVRGKLETSVVQRRARGRDLAEPLGDDRPILQWRGPISAVLAPPAGTKFHGVTLEDDLFFVREELVWAFDGRVTFESARLPLAGTPVPMMQLHGTGTVVLALRAPPSSLPLREGETVHVMPDALVGWTGRLFPEGTHSYDSTVPPLTFRGDGVLLVA